MTSITLQEENSSKWDYNLGFDMNSDQAGIKVPCSVFINNDLCGFSNSVHPDVRCYAFKGNIKQNAIL